MPEDDLISTRNFRRSAKVLMLVVLLLGLPLSGCKKNRHAARFDRSFNASDPALVEEANRAVGEPAELDPIDSFDGDAYRKDLEYIDKALARQRQQQQQAADQSLSAEGRYAGANGRQPVDRRWGAMEGATTPPYAREERDIKWINNAPAEVAGESPNRIARDSQSDPTSATADLQSRDSIDANRGAITMRNEAAGNGSGFDAGLVPPTMDLSTAQVLMDRILRKEAAGSVSPLREYLGVVALSLADPARRVEISRFHDLSDAERELLSAYQEHFIAVSRELESAGGIESLADDIQRFASRATSSGSIRLNTFKACTEVINYGHYKEIKELRFVRGFPIDLVAYVEIENFKSVLGADDQFHTRIKFEIELYTQADGVLVYAEEPTTAHDTCRNYRRDFFLASLVHLPSNLAQGRYSLKVRVTDQQSRSTAESVLPIEIVSQ